MTIQISPSILSADFANLEKDMNEISHADMAHVDVMDYHFVPNLTIGNPVAKRLQELNILPLDVHLMIENPDRWALDYADLGCKSVTFHLNAVSAPVRLARELRKRGSKAAIALRPVEPVEPIFDIIDEFDMVLIMTVEPGFGGQKFLDNQLNKIMRLRDFIEANNKNVDIEVDGGINRETAKAVAQAGANILVAGSSVYSKEDRNAEVDILREIAKENYLNR